MGGRPMAASRARATMATGIAMSAVNPKKLTMKTSLPVLALLGVLPLFSLSTFAENPRSDEALEAEMSVVAQAESPADVDANNTRRNARDRDGSSVTPLDQGNGEADLETTRLIRREIVGTDDLSIDAKNVKIVTANGSVTLRGPVQSEQEKRLIGEIASRVARAGQVTNLLEVKSAASTPVQ